jgi:thioesterase-3
MSVIYSYPVTIKEVYLDTFGHMNNATYLTLFEEARWDCIGKNGYGIEYIRSSGLGPTILEILLTFKKELRNRDEIVIETQGVSYERKIGKLAQRMIRNGELCCHAEFTIGLFSLKERKLVLPTEEWLRAIGMKAP